MSMMLRWDRLRAVVAASHVRHPDAVRLIVSFVTGLTAVVYILNMVIGALSTPLTFEDLMFAARATLVLGLAVWIGTGERERAPTNIEQRQGRIVAIIAGTLIGLLCAVIWLEPMLYRAPVRVLIWWALAVATLGQIWWLVRRGYTQLGATLLLLGGIMHLLAASQTAPRTIETTFTHIVVILIAGLLIRWWAGLLMAVVMPVVITSLHYVAIVPGAADWTATVTTTLLLATLAGIITLYAYSLEQAVNDAQSRATHLAAAQHELQIVIAQQESQIASAVEALGSREAYFRSLVQHSSDVITMLGPDGRVREHTPALTEVFGFAPSTLVDMSLSSWVHPDDQARAQQFLHTVKATPRTSVRIEWRLRHATKGYIHVESVGTNLLHDPNVRSIVVNSRDLSERMALTDRLTYQAFHDALTQLPNRALFTDRLECALTQARRATRQVAVLFLDLDRFKVINDSLGHDVGDHLLMRVADRLQSCVQPTDTVARLGGDEFTVLLAEITGLADAMEIAERIHAVLRQPILLGGQQMCITSSIGIALNEPEVEHGAELLRRADMAMYVAKRNGRAAYAVFTPDMNTQAQDRLVLEHDLRTALKRGEFYLVYQPIVDLHSGDVVGMEALVRWRHPLRGELSPAVFVPLAEETGLIVPLGRWVLETACAAACSWPSAFGKHAPSIAVNVSPRQIEHASLITDVADILRTTGLAPGRLKLEITERVLMQDVTATQRTLHALKALGVQIAVDDFGIEYSSLSYLKRFPIDVLKIDRAFVEGLGAEPVDTAIVQALIRLAQDLKIVVIAEGVETALQVDVLQSLGCQWAQGYYLGRPRADVHPWRSDTMELNNGVHTVCSRQGV